MIVNFSNAVFTVFFMLLFFSIWFFYYFKIYKKNEANKLIKIVHQIEKEQEIAGQLHNVSDQILALEKGTQQKMRKIRVCIYNTDDSLQEIF